MDSNAKRPRGRPRGPSPRLVQLDQPVLDQAAELILEERIPPTTAFRRIVPGIKDTRIRRLQERWRNCGQETLAAAEERKRVRVRKVQEEAVARVRSPASFPWSVDPGFLRALTSILTLDHPSVPTSVIESFSASKNLNELHWLWDCPFVSEMVRMTQPLASSPYMEQTKIVLAAAEQVLGPLGQALTAAEASGISRVSEKAMKALGISRITEISKLIENWPELRLGKQI